MFKKIALVVIVLIGAILAYAATRPDSMDGPTPYIGNLIGVFVNMDTMIGKDFETGLANLKAIAEQ
jgi:hypothetical protein